MKRRRFLVRVLVLVSILVSGIALARAGGPQSPSGSARPLTAAVLTPLGTGFTYQGRLDKDGSPVSDACDMSFRLYDAASLGTEVGSDFHAGVSVTDGLFTVNLDFGPGAFNGDRRWLEIKVDCEEDGFYADLGRQELTAAPYALYAARSGGPENVVTVAKSGGDYTSVQTAIDSITDASADNAYLVWVAPGVYSETVTTKPYVHLQGAGQEATIITSTVTNGSFPPSQATLMLVHDTSLRDLTVGNGGAGSRNAALLATAGTTRTLVSDVTARAHGAGTYYFAIFLTGGDMGITLQNVTGLAENGSGNNFGLYISNGTAATLRGGSFTGRGGSRGYGIYSRGSNTTLVAEDVTALGENGGTENFGLYNYDWTTTTLCGGSFTARGMWSISRGIYNINHASLEAEGIIALAEGGNNNYGMFNDSSAAATLRGGAFTACGGLDAYGIRNSGSGTTLEATDVTVLGENSSNSNRGLYNYDGAEAVLHSGSYTGRGGNAARGIFNQGSGTILKATGVTGLAEDGTLGNYGLDNYDGAEAMLHGGSFTGRGGSDAYGIYNSGSGTTLEAIGVTGLGEDGSESYGLVNLSATAEIDSSRFTGSTDGLYQADGTVRLGVTQLDGGATRVSGTLTCFQVYDGSYGSVTCP